MGKKCHLVQRNVIGQKTQAPAMGKTAVKF